MSWFIRMQNEERSFYDHQMLMSTAVVQLLQEEEEENRKPHRGSVLGRRVVHRDRISGHQKLMLDYFVDNPVYNEDFFRRRFRMTRKMFRDIAGAVEAYDDYFVRKANAAGVEGLSHIQKITAALRMLAYGGPADALDEYLRMGESTTLKCVRHFVRAIVALYGSTYLRPPNEAEVLELLKVAEERGFPGMLGSIDCMHWEWEKCPVAFHGQYRGHFKKPTLILEAVTSHDLWIWHAFFGLPGSSNDINVLHRSPVFDALASGNCFEVTYTVNGREYNMGYYLADGIYPEWATLITDYRQPKTNKEKLFTKMQHMWRKDVERGFAQLQGKYGIIKGPARLWDTEDLKYIVDCIVILHNMGIHYERNLNQLRVEDYHGASVPTLSPNRNVPEISELIDKYRHIRSREGHQQLKNDLIDHVWQKFGRIVM